MYIHIGEDFIIKSNNIIAIINIDYVKNTKDYKKMCANLEENNNLFVISNKKQKTFIITEEDNIKKGYITNISVNTIIKRLV